METERSHVAELIVILKQILSLPNQSATNACQLVDTKKCVLSKQAFLRYSNSHFTEIF